MAKKETQPRLSLLLRLAIGAIAVAVIALEIVSFEVARAINLNYFKDPTVRIPAQDIAFLLIALYLLFIAISGRWQLYRRDQ